MKFSVGNDAASLRHRLLWLLSGSLFELSHERLSDIAILCLSLEKGLVRCVENIASISTCDFLIISIISNILCKIFIEVRICFFLVLICVSICKMLFQTALEIS